MSEYYGTPAASSDFLAHYGVKGMRWGVRKAVASGNTKALDKQYHKANKKLQKLYSRANPQNYINKANKLDSISKKARVVGRVGAGVATIGTLGAVGAKHGSQYARDKSMSVIKRNQLLRTEGLRSAKANQNYGLGHLMLEANGSIKKSSPTTLPNNFEVGYKRGMSQAAEAGRLIDKENKRLQNIVKTSNDISNISKAFQASGAGIAALGYGTAVGSKIRANALRKKASNVQKMKDARQKALDFEREMNREFAGTKYEKKMKHRNRG